MKITIHENITYDYVQVEKTSDTLASTRRIMTYSPAPTNNTEFMVVFNQKLASVNTSSRASAATILSIWRQQNGEAVKHQVMSVPTSLDAQFIVDHGAVEGKSYVYSLEPETPDVIYDALQSDEQHINNNSWILISTTYNSDYDIYEPERIYKFMCNPLVGEISNNAQIVKTPTFGRFYKLQVGQTNALSGQLTSMVGYFDCSSAQYVETEDIDDALRWLVTDGKIKFLKDLRGHIWQVAISDAQTFLPYDDAGYMEHTLSWTEIGDADDVSIVALGE